MSQETPARSGRPGSAPLGLPVPPGYEVLEELGRGGMGVVYKARNTLMDRLEVLKVVNQQQLGPGAGVDRFLREIRSAAKLSHPNIVAAYTAYQVEGSLVFAMEYVPGADLAQVVGDRGPLPVANACQYVQQAALGLQHAFEKGMVHRDVKPQNLMLTIVGQKHTVKVLDFGLAKATHEGQDQTTRLTVLGKTMGTPDYIAPEQVRDAASADIRADIYSLGCTLYHLLSGEPPFLAQNLAHLLYSHKFLPAMPLNELRGEVSLDLAAVVARMMAKDPALRHQQPIEVLGALAPFVKAGLQPLSPNPVVAKQTRDPKFSPEQRALLNQATVLPPALPEPLRQARPVESGQTVLAPKKRTPTKRVRAAPAPRRGNGLLTALAVGGGMVGLLLLAGAISFGMIALLVNKAPSSQPQEVFAVNTAPSPVMQPKTTEPAIPASKPNTTQPAAPESKLNTPEPPAPEPKPVNPQPPASQPKPVAPQPPAQESKPNTPVQAPGLSFDIKAPTLKGDKEERTLTSATDDLCLGGGGRFVLLSLPKEQKIAVFDVNEANVVKTLDIGEDGIKIAANMDKLFVIVVAKDTIQRWSLRTFEKEMDVPLPFKGTVQEVCTGHAGHGPLVVGLKEADGSNGSLKYLNSTTLGLMDMEYPPKAHVFTGKHLRASADGRVFAAIADPAHINSLVLYGGRAISYLGAMNTNLAIPNPDGRTIYVAWDAVGLQMNASLKLDGATSPVTLPYLPAQQGNLFMRLEDHVTRDLMKIPRPVVPAKEGGDVEFFLPGHRSPFSTWRDVEGVFGSKSLTSAKSLTYDQRFILLPTAGVFITIPAGNDKLVLHRFDLDDLLAKSNKDYLFVASSPVLTATKGTTYTYAVEVKSKTKPVQYKLVKSPAGMKISPEGKITWEVPDAIPPGEVEVAVTATAGMKGPAVKHSFKIEVEK